MNCSKSGSQITSNIIILNIVYDKLNGKNVLDCKIIGSGKSTSLQSAF